MFLVVKPTTMAPKLRPVCVTVRLTKIDQLVEFATMMQKLGIKWDVSSKYDHPDNDLVWKDWVEQLVVTDRLEEVSHQEVRVECRQLLDEIDDGQAKPEVASRKDAIGACADK